MLMSFITLLSACNSTSNTTGPVGTMYYFKWKDSTAWSSGRQTWAYTVMEIHNADTMEKVYEDNFFQLAREIELPAGNYIATVDCYIDTRNANNPRLYTKTAKHNVSIEAGKTQVFDFVKTTRNECTLSQRSYSS